MPTIKSLQPKLGDQVLVYTRNGTIEYSENNPIYPIAGTVIAMDDGNDYWLGWMELPPKGVIQSPSLRNTTSDKKYVENWEKFGFSVILGSLACVHSVVSKTITPSVKLDQPCRQCGRNCTPGDQSCWWCQVSNPC